MDLLIHDLRLGIICSKPGEIIAQIRPCDQDFFKSWLRKVYAARPWEECTSASRKVVKCGFLVESGEDMGSSAYREELDLYPRHIDLERGLVAFSTFSTYCFSYLVSIGAIT